MRNNKIICFVVIVCWVLLGVGIFLNPYASVDYLNANPSLCININVFFEMCGLGYRFGTGDVVNLVRLTEYAVFGIISTMIVKVYSKNIWKNICVPLFLGLGLSVGEIYFKSFNNVKIGLCEVVMSFGFFCIGMLLYIILSGRKFSGKKNYKFIKYGRKH